jgi:hypothetical protein
MIPSWDDPWNDPCHAPPNGADEKTLIERNANVFRDVAVVPAGFLEGDKNPL